MEKQKQSPTIKVPRELKGLLDNLKVGDESYQSVINRLVAEVTKTAKIIKIGEEDEI